MIKKPDIDIKAVTRLSKLSLAKDEQKTIAENVVSILEYVDKLQEVDTSGVGHSHRQMLTQETLRQDEVIECSKVTRNLILENMPKRNKDLLEVPEVFES